MAKKKGNPPPSYLAFEVFMAAQSFGRAALALSDRVPSDEFFVWPMVVNQALCLELHLKCLRRIRGKYSFGHDAQFIFNQLSRLDRSSIKSHLKRIIAEGPPDPSLDHKQLELESSLLRNRDTFKTGRYWFEGTLPKPDTYGNRGNAGTDFLTEAVLRRILQLRPVWREQLKRSGFKFENSPVAT